MHRDRVGNGRGPGVGFLRSGTAETMNHVCQSTLLAIPGANLLNRRLRPPVP